MIYQTLLLEPKNCFRWRDAGLSLTPKHSIKLNQKRSIKLTIFALPITVELSLRIDCGRVPLAIDDRPLGKSLAAGLWRIQAVL
jgi:hypothetical protein